jgi:hypothetical protein
MTGELESFHSYFDNRGSRCYAGDKVRLVVDYWPVNKWQNSIVISARLKI